MTAEIEKNEESTSSLKSIYKIGILILIFGIAAYFLNKNPDYLNRIKGIPEKTILTLLFLHIITHIVKGARVIILLKEWNINVKLREALSLTYTNSFLNIIPLHFGLVYKALFLKNKFHLSYHRFSILTAIGFFMNLLSGLLVSFVLACFLFLSGKPIQPWFILIILSLFFGIVWIMKAPNKIFDLPLAKPLQRFKEVNEEWKTVRRNKNLILKLFINDLFLLGLTSSRWYIAFLSIQLSLTYLDSVIIVAMSQLSSLVALSPGSLGIREAIAGIIAGCLLLPIDLSILAASVDRAVSFLAIIPIGTLGILYLSKVSKQE